MELSSSGLKNHLLWKITDMSRQNLRLCYQCGKCSAGCPIADSMDVPPHKVIRLLQLGEVEEAMRSKTIWACAACFTCATRCPKGVDLSKIMEALRSLLLRKGTYRLRPEAIPAGVLSKAPQQGLVAGLRKYS